MHGLLCVWISGHFFYVALPPAVQSSEQQREVENSPSFTNKHYAFTGLCAFNFFNDMIENHSQSDHAVFRLWQTNTTIQMI